LLSNDEITHTSTRTTRLRMRAAGDDTCDRLAA
jgi:hypothetical protein